MVNFKADGKMIFLIFIGAIIATTLIVSIGDQINLVTSEFTITNETVTVSAVNTTLDLTGRTLATRTSVLNASDPGASDNINLILQTGTGSNGLRTVQIVANDSASEFVGTDVNVTYTYEPNGYVSDTGGRAITLLILIFSALAILIYVIAQLFEKDTSLSKLIKGL